MLPIVDLYVYYFEYMYRIEYSACDYNIFECAIHSNNNENIT